MTTRSNLYIDQGTDFSSTVEIFTDYGDEFDITSRAFLGSVKKLYSSTKVFDIDLSIIPGVPNNDLLISIPAEKTANTAPGKYQYDIVMVTNNTARLKILEGLLFVLPTVTST